MKEKGVREKRVGEQSRIKRMHQKPGPISHVQNGILIMMYLTTYNI
jgi:hypothetical protein